MPASSHASMCGLISASMNFFTPRRMPSCSWVNSISVSSSIGTMHRPCRVHVFLAFLVLLAPPRFLPSRELARPDPIASEVAFMQRGQLRFHHLDKPGPLPGPNTLLGELGNVLARLALTQGVANNG